MVDSSGKGSESSEEKSPNSAAKSPSNSGEQKKTCADCGTSKTPLWRGGPAGPKSLCNACGIRSRKKKRATILGITKGTGDDPKKGKRSSSNNNSKVKLGVGGGDSLNLKQRLWALGRQVLMQRSNHSHNHRNKLGEEEQAAVLLMSLSYGSVYA